MNTICKLLHVLTYSIVKAVLPEDQCSSPQTLSGLLLILLQPRKEGWGNDMHSLWGTIQGKAYMSLLLHAP